MKLLLIEDEKELANSLISYFKEEGYLCEWANNFSQAEEKIQLYEYDCILVDITLPGGNGLSIVEQLKKKRSNAGIIIISAKNSIDDKIGGLDLGADDYVPKPFNLAELNSRIRSVIRRRNFDGNEEIKFNEIAINSEHKIARVNQNNLVLTKREYELLLFFVVNKNKIITKESIAEHLWGDDMDLADSYDFIYTHIKNLRKKLVDAGAEDYVKTVYGMGYKFAER